MRGGQAPQTPRACGDFGCPRQKYPDCAANGGADVIEYFVDMKYFGPLYEPVAADWGFETKRRLCHFERRASLHTFPQI